MSRKHFEAVASAMNTSQPTQSTAAENKRSRAYRDWSERRHQWRQSCIELTRELRATNGRFDNTRFLRACGFTEDELRNS